MDLLLPLTTCRNNSFYLPWKCEHERHTYEKCLYDEYVAMRDLFANVGVMMVVLFPVAEDKLVSRVRPMSQFNV